MRTRLWCLAAASVWMGCAQTTTAPNEVAIPGGKVINYQPVTAKERLQWYGWTTFGPAGIGGNVVSAGFGTALDRPKEYGTHWEGFGDRVGMGLSGNAVSNAMEASIGSLWGEDPRYFRAPDETFRQRVVHVIKWSFVASNRDGHAMPAWSRYMAIGGSNFLSNTWRERSEADTSHAVVRIGFGFLGHMASNAFTEFWPDIKQHAFHRGH
ncbi:MAG TPA: hypothetical protein VFA04_14370 [Bryobacteraceae bacterium]|nr:hypothetical protein [Bryobacteraceae bacterium]